MSERMPTFGSPLIQRIEKKAVEFMVGCPHTKLDFGLINPVFVARIADQIPWSRRPFAFGGDRVIRLLGVPFRTDGTIPRGELRFYVGSELAGIIEGLEDD